MPLFKVVPLARDQVCIYNTSATIALNRRTTLIEKLGEGILKDIKENNSIKQLCFSIKIVAPATTTRKSHPIPRLQKYFKKTTKHTHVLMQCFEVQVFWIMPNP